MRNRELLRQILEGTRDLWDRPDTRPDVRENFARMLNCRTAALGGEVYASPTGEETLFCHTCKSRACPSCGYRATLLWQEMMRALLPDTPALALPCQASSGRSFSKTATYFMICLRLEPR